MGYQKINLLIKGGYNMTNKALSIFNQLRPVTIGFDNVFDHFERMFDHQFDSISVPNFPPYNIVKTGDNKYDVELALAGFNKKDIDVTVEDGTLTIKSIVKEAKDKKEDGVKVLLKDTSLNLLKSLMMLKLKVPNLKTVC